MRHILASLAAAGLLVASPIAAKAPPDNWDGLVRVAGKKKMDLLYVRPKADIRSYQRVMLDPPEVAFDKNWRRNYERTTTSHLSRLSDKDIRRAIDDGRQMLTEAFSNALRKSGYQIATAPDSDVLRLSIYLLNVRIVAPGTRFGGPIYTVSTEAGSATLALEARDSVSGQLLGRVVDQEVIDDWHVHIRDDVSNRWDFGQQFDEWARISAVGLRELQSAPPTP